MSVFIFRDQRSDAALAIWFNRLNYSPSSLFASQIIIRFAHGPFG